MTEAKNLSLGAKGDDSITYTTAEALEALKNVAEAEGEFLRTDAERDIVAERTGARDSVKPMNDAARAAQAAEDRWHGEVDCADWRGVHRALAARIERLEAALRFYAEKANHRDGRHTGGMSDVYVDAGERARAALKEPKND